MTVLSSALVAYKRYLKNKGWDERPGQRMMVDAIIEAFAQEKKHAIVEAGTGVGKTLAYSVPAIAHTMEAGKKLIISTASVALQDQIIQDMPDIIANSGLDFSYAVAKGRRRYVCPARLFGEAVDAQEDLEIIDEDEAENDSGVTSAIEVDKVEELSKFFSREEWNGDRDVMPIEVKPATWASISTDHKGCNKNSCIYAMQCPYLKARLALENKQVIVANHSLVLADIANGGGIVLPATHECAYVFDEAHHLPDSMLGFFRKELNLGEAVKSYRKIMRDLEKLSVSFPYATINNMAAKTVESVDGLITKLRTLKTVILPPLQEYANKQGIFRFRLGRLPAELQKEFKNLMLDWKFTVDQVEGIIAVMTSEACKDMKQARDTWLPVASKIRGELAEAALLWKCYGIERKNDDKPLAKWVEFSGKRVTVVAGPTHAGKGLNSILWSKAYAVICASATLRYEGDFGRALDKIGAPQGTLSRIVPSPYDYAKMVTFDIPDFGFDPTPDNERKTTIAITRYLTEKVNWKAGNLVLFTSFRQLKDVYNMLPESMRKRVLCQDEYSKSVLIQTHKVRIDEGNGSTLFGVNSLAEGVNLPGKYVTHVVITKIPFDVPSDPVAQTIDEHCRVRGGSSFNEFVMPAASTRLNQACGRLIRSEKDGGTISILDRRIISKRYGKALLESLPMWTAVHAEKHRAVWSVEDNAANGGR
jgi:ATP-dependent DNA helicase DinG